MWFSCKTSAVERGAGGLSRHPVAKAQATRDTDAEKAENKQLSDGEQKQIYLLIKAKDCTNFFFLY